MAQIGYMDGGGGNKKDLLSSSNSSSASLSYLRRVASAQPMFGSPLEDVVLGEGMVEGGCRPEQYRSALVKTGMAVGAAFAFGGLTWLIKGEESGMEFMAGYLVEQSLSVDNLFVFIMLFDYFAVPLQYQDRVLTWGIIGAVVMRGFMIGLGVAVVKKFRWIIIVFAGILLVSSAKLLQEGDDEHDLTNNTVVKIAKRLVGACDKFDGDQFFTLVGGKRVATPLLLCLVCIELSDFVFAVDSIPAVLGVSQDPFVVYSSNIFAIMGLRSIYTIIAKAVNQLPYLKPAVALVLGFVGIKMILEFFHFEISTGFSLSVVVLLIVGGVVLSLIGGSFIKGSFKRRNSENEISLPSYQVMNAV
jgi:tellurite resistance protein TerC